MAASPHFESCYRAISEPLKPIGLSKWRNEGLEISYLKKRDLNFMKFHNEISEHNEVSIKVSKTRMVLIY